MKKLTLLTLLSGSALFAATPPVPKAPTARAPQPAQADDAVPAPQAAQGMVQEMPELTNIGISAENRKKMAAVLNTLLGHEAVLYVKTLNYHWNVTGPFFGPLHALFKDQYEMLEKSIDEVAERTRALDAHAAGSMQEFLKLSTTIKEMPGAQLADVEMIKDLLDGHEAVIRFIRTAQADAAEKFGDAGTNNMLLNLMEKHEKIAWMLRAHLTQIMR